MSNISKISKYLNVVIILAIIITFGYCFFASEIYISDNWGQDEKLKLYTRDWYVIDEAGDRLPFEVPGEVDLQGREEFTLVSTLPPTIVEDTYLCFRSAKQDMIFYVDGKIRSVYSNEYTRHTGKFSPVARVFVKIHPSDAGKELTVKVTTKSSYGGTVLDVYQGSQFAFWENSLRNNGFELAMALVMFFVSTVIIIIALLIRLRIKEMKLDLVFISFGMITVFTWVIANSDLRQLLFANLSIVSDLAYLMILLIPAPFLIYVNSIQNKRYSQLLGILKTVVIVDFFVCTILHFTSIVDYDESFLFMASIDAVSVLTIIGTLFVDLFRGRIKEYLNIAIGLFAVIICGLIQMVLYIAHIYDFGGTIMSFGAIFLLFCEVYRTVRLLQQVQLDKIDAINAKEARSRFLANMSHELRTPINSVLGLNTMILRECDDENIRKYARDIQSAGKSLLSVINDILDFSKIDSGKMEIVPVDYDFSSIINDLNNMIRPKAIEKGLIFTIDVEENLPAWYRGDDVRIKQILINLLTNAVKYTSSGEVALRVFGEKIGDEEELLFSVSDTGIGIKQEDLQKLNQEFVRIEESRNRNIEGTGLGINIVSELLKLMNSKLEVKSVYGEGSDFSFRLIQPIVKAEPIGDINERIMYTTDTTQYNVAFAIPDCRLLVVDDNSMNRVVFINLLKDMECVIDEAESGFECLEMINDKKYDIIFMDHMMPDMDGVETFHRIKKMEGCINADTPVVILTANAISGARDQYMSEGFNDYLTKPIDTDKLEAMIGELIPDNKKRASSKKQKDNKAKETFEIDLPYIDGVEWNSAFQKLKNEVILRKSIENFSVMAKSDLDQLQVMYDKLNANQSEETFSEYRIKVHAMKSNAATIGAYHVAGLAKYLEYAARDKDINVINKLMDVFANEWLTLKKSIDEAFDLIAESDDNLTPIDPDELKELLEILKAAMDEFDYDRADAVVEELSEHSYAEREKEFLEKVKNCVLNLDGITCVEVVDQWLNIDK